MLHRYVQAVCIVARVMMNKNKLFSLVITAAKSRGCADLLALWLRFGMSHQYAVNYTKLTAYFHTAMLANRKIFKEPHFNARSQTFAEKSASCS